MVVVVVTGSMVWSVGSLWGYHSWLILQGMTTHEHIRDSFRHRRSPFRAAGGLLAPFIGLPSCTARLFLIFLLAC